MEDFRDDRPLMSLSFSKFFTMTIAASICWLVLSAIGTLPFAFLYLRGLGLLFFSMLICSPVIIACLCDFEGVRAHEMNLQTPS